MDVLRGNMHWGDNMQDDLISRRVAIELIHSLYPSAPIMRINRKRWEEKYKPYIETEKALEQLPSAQPEIIRCRDCKHYYYADNHIPQEQRYTCDLDGFKWMADSYCSYAERREAE